MMKQTNQTNRIVYRLKKKDFSFSFLHLLRRILLLLLSILALSAAVFFIARLAPGDPLVSYYGERAERMSTEERAFAIEKLGLSKPLPIQYVDWLSNALHGNFGISFKYKTDVLSVVKSRAGNTLLLGGVGFLLIFFGSLFLGIFCARQEGRFPDRLLQRLGVLTSCIPEFWLALVLILVFSVHLGLFPASGAYTIGREIDTFDRLWHLVLPLTVVVLGHLWYYAYLVRSRMLDEARADYVLLARAKGLSAKRVLFKHCLRNFLPAYLSIMAIAVPHILGGTYIVETVFSYPGLGTLAYESARYKDYNLLSFLCLLTAVVILLFSFLGQRLGEWLDPRMRPAGSEKQVSDDETEFGYVNDAAIPGVGIDGLAIDGIDMADADTGRSSNPHTAASSRVDTDNNIADTPAESSTAVSGIHPVETSADDAKANRAFCAMHANESEDAIKAEERYAFASRNGMDIHGMNANKTEDASLFKLAHPSPDAKAAPETSKTSFADTYNPSAVQLLPPEKKPTEALNASSFAGHKFLSPWFCSIRQHLRQFHSWTAGEQLSAILLLLLFLGCLFLPAFFTKEPGYIDLLHAAEAPSPAFPFGTDTLGRDLFAMIWSGGRLSLFIGFFSAFLSAMIAILLGTISGLSPKPVDAALMRFTELFLCIPNLLLIVLLQAIFGKATPFSLAFVIGLCSWPALAKVVRAEVLRLRSSEYVLAARCMGASFFYLLRRHLTPNFISSIMFMIVMSVRSAITSESTLSFMGIGLPVETVSWGSMLSLSEQALMTDAWWIILVPGSFLIITLLCITSLANRLRQALDRRAANL